LSIASIIALLHVESGGEFWHWSPRQTENRNDEIKPILIDAVPGEGKFYLFLIEPLLKQLWLWQTYASQRS
jgi:hypothetical protein